MSDESAETASHDDRDVRLGRILDDYLSRRSRGEACSESALLAQYPELVGELREMLTLVRDLRPADKIQSLINQGTLTRSTNPRYLAELGPYKITGYLGRGGMGIVLKAYEESLNRIVALKILRPDLADDGHALTRFEREAKAAAALNHPNIVTVHAVGTERDVHYIAMEYVEGPSLADVIHEVASGLRAGRIREGEAPAEPPATSAPGGTAPGGTAVSAVILDSDTIRSIFRQLLSALAAAHEAGLIHRDVKSSNILLANGPNRARSASEGPGDWGSTIDDCGLKQEHDDDASAQSPIPNPQSPIVKLADFGLARMVTATTRVTLGDSILGTPEYMSPEQARGDTDIDHRTDLYSAGVVLYELLTGRTPFRADTPTATIRRILDEEPENPRELNVDVDPNLSSLALRLMAKRPDDRFSSAREAIVALDADDRVHSSVRRRRVRRYLTTALIGLAALVGGGWLMSRGVFGPRMIAAVRIDPDTQLSIQVRYGDDTRWCSFHVFPSEVSRVTGAELLELSADGHQAVTACLETPLESCNVFAFDAKGDELWRQSVSNHPSIEEWPDCGPCADWPCRGLVVGDIDGKPGEEAVVLAHDVNSYATRVSVLDARTGEITYTFWHMGHLDQVRVVPDLLGLGRPALCAWGVNNKLDGFKEPGFEDWKPLTKYDQVSVLMVLDPTTGDGAGPPRTPQLDLPSLGPFAYAFLDIPASDAGGSYLPEGQSEPVFPKLSETAEITQIRLIRGGADDAQPLIRVEVGRSGGRGGAILTVDRQLQLRHCELVDGETLRRDVDYWRNCWKTISRDQRDAAD